MSYDEQPDGDPHGECAAEIQRELADLTCIDSEVPLDAAIDAAIAARSRHSREEQAAMKAERDAAVRELEKRRVPLDYPGDEAAVKQSGSNLGLCTCAGRGDDDDHKPSCQFWQGILAARRWWNERHVVAWSCSSEAKNGTKCETWCGWQRYCTASTRDDISIDAAIAARKP